LKPFEPPPGWVDFYHSALLEVDYQKLAERLSVAENAIRARLQMLSEFGNREELSAIQDARQNLRVLQKELDAHQSSSAGRIGHSQPEIGGKYVVFVDADRRYVEVTDGVCELLGYTREELLAKTIDDITAPEMRSHVPETFRQYVAEGGMEGRHGLLAKDGGRIWIHYQSKVYPDGRLVARWEPLNSNHESRPEVFDKRQAS
jgi:PAS domain S-box-containing protein